MLNASPDLFRTLADPTRRAVFDRLARREATVSELTKHFDVSQPAISQHLKTLRDAGLVEARRKGREAHYRVRPDGLAPMIDWLEHHKRFWAEHGDNLKRLLKEMDR